MLVPRTAGTRQASGSVGSRAYIVISGTYVCLGRFPVRLPFGSRALRQPRAWKDVFDIYTIIFLALAVFIFLRLRSVLGQRTGRERPPYDPYSARDAVRGATNDNIVKLPPGRPAAEAPQRPLDTAEPAERWKGIAEPGTAVAGGLDTIASEDKTFDARHFVTGARQAYEMIVLAYAQGDRRNLKNLLAREVYEGFEAAMRERDSKGETVETRF